MRSAQALMVVSCLLGAVPFTASAQIVSGRMNEGGVRSGMGRFNVPPIPLDTNVGSRGPTFRASVTRVEVSALVVDAQGKPVRDLRAEDFEVLDGGRKQRVASFTPYSRAARAIPLDELPDGDSLALATNAWVADSRIIALLIDDLHIDARHAERARTAARRLIDALAPSDLLFVGLTSTPSISTGAFTRDRRRAREIVDGFGGLRLLNAIPEMRQGYLNGPSATGLAGSDHQRAQRLADAYAAVQRIAMAARPATGRRKTLVLLTEGSPVGAGQTASTNLTVETTSAMLDAVAAATAADMAIYPLGPAGLDLPTDRMTEGFTRAVDADNPHREIAHEDLRQLIAEFLQAKNQLRDLAALTGGVSLVDRNDVGGAITRVLDDASDYYLLSYEPDKAVKGTKVRPIEVRVKRPGLRVLSRRGYLAPPAGPESEPGQASLSPAMRALLTGVVPDDGLPMTVQAFPVAAQEGRTRFAVVVETAGGPLVAALEKGLLPLEQAVTSVDAEGRLGTVVQKAGTLKVGDALAQSIGARGLRSLWVMDLPPGTHQVRVGTVHPVTGRAGSMYVDLVVDAAQPLETASLAAVAENPMPTAFIAPEIAALLPGGAP